MHVRLGGSDDAGCERGRIEIVLGVENQRDIHHLGVQLAGLLARHAPQQVRSQVEIRIGIDRRLTLTTHLAVADDRGNLCEQSFGLAHLSLGRVVLAIGIDVREQRYAGAQDSHGMGVIRAGFTARDFADHFQDPAINGAHRHEFVLEALQFVSRRLVTHEQHVCDFFKRRVLSEVGDLIPAVDQLGLRDLAYLGVADGLPRQAARVCGFLGGFNFGRAGHGHVPKEKDE